VVDRVLPTGTLTFLFTDLEGSTRLLHELDEQYGGILETHRRLIRAAVERHGGVEFGTGGDAVFVAFESAPAAVAAAAEANRSLNDHPWPDGAAPRPRDPSQTRHSERRYASAAGTSGSQGVVGSTALTGRSAMT
jgi:class 3 adenylate cyclase